MLSLSEGKIGFSTGEDILRLEVECVSSELAVEGLINWTSTAVLHRGKDMS